ncbi:MAG: hypothetical protein HY331_06315 [Chloroflexi bacterium]|nr:hypothetical protein [Chloroflexota bacterium]
MGKLPRRIAPLLHALVLLSLAVGPLLVPFDPLAPTASAATFPTPTNLSSNSGDSRFPAMAIDATGQVTLVWADTTAGTPQILGRRWTAGGGWGAAVVVASGASLARPAVAVVPSTGAAAVAWLSGSDVFYRLWPQTSGVLGAAGQISNGGVLASPAVAADGAGAVHVFWIGASGSAADLFHRVDRGGVLGSVEALSGGTAESDPPAAAADGTGAVHVAWADSGSGNREIFYRSWSGAAWSAPANLSGSAGYSALPALSAGATAGTVVLTWSDNNVGGAIAWRIYTRELSGGGWSAPVDVSGDTGNLTTSASFVGGDGVRHFVWSRPSTFGGSVGYRNLSSGAWSARSTVASLSGGLGSPAIAVDGAGRIVVGWSDGGVGGAADVYAAVGSAAAATPTPTPTPAIRASPTPTMITSTAPSLITPTQGVQIAGASPVLAWQPVTGAVGYRVDLDTASTFDSANLRTGTTENLHAVPIDAVPITSTNRTLYWRVTPLDGGGRTGRTSSTESFVVPAATAPRLLAPEDLYLFTLPSTPITATWTPVPGASSYLIEVTDVLTVPSNLLPDGGFVSRVYSDTTPNTSYSAFQTRSLAETLVEGRMYYWHVASLDAAGRRLPFSETRRLFKQWVPPAPLTPNDPSFNNVISPTEYYSVTLVWEPADGAASYDLEVYYYGDFSAAVYSAHVVGANRHTLKQTLPDDQYVWRVRANDSKGLPGPWSTLATFKKRWNDAPIALGPLSSDADPRFPLMSWTSIPHAGQYVLEFHNFTIGGDKINIERSVGRTEYVPTIQDTSMRAPVGITLTHEWYVIPVDNLAPGTNLNHEQAYLRGLNSIAQSFTIATPTIGTVPWPPPSRSEPPPRGPAADWQQPYPDRPAETTDVFTGTTPVFAWQPVAGARQYNVYISKDETFNNLAMVAGPAFSTFYPFFTLADPLPDSDAGIGYHVSVQVEMDSGLVSLIDISHDDVYRFNKVTPPGPLLASPPPYAEVSGAPTFTWEPITKTDTRCAGNARCASTTYYYPTAYYRIQVSRDPDFGTVDAEELTDAESITLSGWNKPDGFYYWRVCPEEFGAERSCETSVSQRRTWSEARIFRAVSGFDVVPLLAPADGVTVTLTPMFSWRPVAGAVTYDVQVIATASLTQTFDDYPLHDGIVATDKVAYQTNRLPYPQGTYHWRVRARNARGSTSDWSAPRTFAIQLPPPEGLTVNTISATGAVVTHTSPITVDGRGSGFHLAWSPVAGAAGYRVEVSTDPAFGSLADSATTEAASWAPRLGAQYRDLATHYWRVLPLDRAGIAGRASATGSFVPDPPVAPAAPEPTATRTATPSATPTATPVPSATPTPAATATPSATSTPTASAPPVAASSGSPTATPTPTAPPATPTPTPTATSAVAGLVLVDAAAAPNAEVSAQLPHGSLSLTLPPAGSGDLIRVRVAVPSGPPPAEGTAPGVLLRDYQFDITLRESTTGQPITQLAGPLTFVLRYDPARLAGAMAATLELRFWNGTAWSTDGIRTTVDPVRRELRAQIDHTSRFAVFGRTVHRQYLPYAGRSAASAGW